MNSDKMKLTFVSLILLGLFLLIIFGMKDFITTIFLALVVAAITRPWYLHLRKKSWKKGSATAFILFSLLTFVLIIAFLFGSALINKFSEFSEDKLIDALDGKDLSTIFTDINLSPQQALSALAMALQVGIGITGSVLTLIVLTTIFIYVFYRALTVDSKVVTSFIKDLSPFSKEGTQRLIDEYDAIMNSSVLTTLIVGILQGTILAFGFLVAGVNDVLLIWLLCIFAAFVPIIGSGLMWVPAGLYFIFSGQFGWAAWIVGIGIFIGIIDNVVRPKLQQKIQTKTKLHELTALFGVLMGLQLFGYLGVILGPFLVSYFVILFNLVRKEFLAM